MGVDTSGDLSGFLSIFSQAWDALMTEFYIYGYVFSYGRLLLLLIAGGIVCLMVRKGFFD